MSVCQTSSSHALIGGMAGAGIAAAGVAGVKLSTVVVVAEFMVISPIIGLIVGFLFMVVVLRVTRNLHREQADHHFRRLQLVSAGAYSFSHGTNDAQKTMGIITPLLFSIGYYGTGVDPNNLPIPIWVILIAYSAIALGTFLGGWRIVKTLGYKITKLRPVHGFAAETVSAGTILGMSFLGIPVSTTHIISTAIMGVGSTKGPGAVRWGIARNIVGAWILTIPAAAAIGFAAYWAIAFLHLTERAPGQKRGRADRPTVQECRITMSEMMFATVSQRSVARSSSWSTSLSLMIRTASFVLKRSERAWPSTSSARFSSRLTSITRASMSLPFESFLRRRIAPWSSTAESWIALPSAASRRPTPRRRRRASSGPSPRYSPRRRRGPSRDGKSPRARAA